MKIKILSKTILFAVFIFFSLTGNVSGTHIVGGEICYKCVDPTGYTYQLTLKFYRNCAYQIPSSIPFADSVYIGIYDQDSVKIGTYPIGLKLLLPPTDTVTNFTYMRCKFAPPDVCVEQAIYQNYINLPPRPGGYLLMFQQCCRNAAIVNIVDPMAHGASWVVKVPDTTFGGCNSSACFALYPPTIICANEQISFKHYAIDSDADSLSYALCNVMDGSWGDGGAMPPPPDTIPQFPIGPYVPGYRYTNPLGGTGADSLKIDPVTGMLSGIATAVGQYVVAVCVSEYRNGVLLNVSKRDFQYNVADCDSALVANFTYDTDPCASDYTVNFINLSESLAGWPLLGAKYHWDFGIAALSDDTSNLEHPSYNFPDTGTYSVTLVVNPGYSCEETIIINIVIEEFELNANFLNDTVCALETVTFSDLSFSPALTIVSWDWYFGDGNDLKSNGHDGSDPIEPVDDNGLQTGGTYQNPTHTYSTDGNFTIRLIITTSDGCTDTLEKQVVFYPLPLANGGVDVSIVMGEDTSLSASATGGDPPYSFTWTPSIGLNTTIGTDVTASPLTTTTYNIRVVDNKGCIDNDKVVVYVEVDLLVEVPTAFTPDGDGLNDVFLVYDLTDLEGIGIKEMDFRIFNRWGEIVYLAETIDQALVQGWDGTHRKNGKEMEIGVYVWLLNVTKLDGKKVGPLYGNVSLIR